jgi:protoporphyrinogen oxidase
VFDRGIHILQTTNTAVLDLLGELGIEFEIHRRHAFIYSHKTYTPYPFQINTAGLPLGLRARCVLGYLRRSTKTKPRNYEEWMYRNLGRGFADTFLIPYSEKFWTVHPREMTFEWAGSRVPQPTLRQVIRGAVWSRRTDIGSNAQFRYPKGGGGYGAVGKALEQKSGALYLGYRATRLNVSRQEVTFSNGERVRYQALINTIPLPDLVRICEDAPEHVRAATAKLRTNSILVVNLGIGHPNVSDRHWVHFPEKDVSFFRISYPHTFGPGLTPEGMSSISAEVAYSAWKPVGRANIVEQVIEDLIRVGALDRRHPVVSRSVYDIQRAYCIYDMQRQEALRTILGWLREVGIVTCGRYGLWTYFWSDEAILSGKKAAENVSRRREIHAS